MRRLGTTSVFLRMMSSAPLARLAGSRHAGSARELRGPHYPGRRSTTVSTQMTTRHPARTEHRTARSLPVVAGIGYSLAWIISLSVGAPTPAVAARGSQVVAAFAGHGGSAMAMFVLAEGVAAA